MESFEEACQGLWIGVDSTYVGDSDRIGVTNSCLLIELEGHCNCMAGSSLGPSF